MKILVFIRISIVVIILVLRHVYRFLRSRRFVAATFYALLCVGSFVVGVHVAGIRETQDKKTGVLGLYYRLPTDLDEFSNQAFGGSVPVLFLVLGASFAQATNGVSDTVGVCAICKYDLTGHDEGGRCPECGTTIPHQTKPLFK